MTAENRSSGIFEEGFKRVKEQYDLGTDNSKKPLFGATKRIFEFWDKIGLLQLSYEPKNPGDLRQEGLQFCELFSRCFIVGYFSAPAAVLDVAFVFGRYARCTAEVVRERGSKMHFPVFFSGPKFDR